MTDSATRSGAMAGKTVLVTGGTGGIGRATALALAARGARVGITGRDPARTRAAAAELAGQAAAAAGTSGATAGAGSVLGAGSQSPQIDAFPADMSAQGEVRRLAAAVLDTYPRLDVLVNNVGGLWGHRHVTTDGLEQTFALNHLAGFLLTDLLLDRLKASAPARIVTVSSAVHKFGRLDFDDLQSEHGYTGQRAYNQSKLASVMFTYELARRLEGTGVTATVLHPGVVKTSFAAEDAWPVWGLGMPLIRPFMRTPAKGAATSVHLASSAEVEGVTGRYFVNCKPKRSKKSSYDTAAATRLWQVSAELVGTETGA
jgi:retinol dehydrogenase 14